MTIRRATYADVAALRGLFHGLVTEQQAAFPHQQYPGYDAAELDAFTLDLAGRLGHHDPNFLCWVAVDDQGAAVGFLGGTIGQRPYWTPRRFASPCWLYVAPLARGYGVARALVAAGLQWLVAEGIEAVELSALPGDRQWIARGFTPYLVRYVATVAGITEQLVAAAEAQHAAATAVRPKPYPREPSPPDVQPAARHAAPKRRRKAKRRRRTPKPAPNGHDRTLAARAAEVEE